MEEYTSNLNKYKDANPKEAPSKKKIEKIITGSASKKKKNDVRKFLDKLLPEDAIHDPKSYILWDLIVPTVIGSALNALNSLFSGVTDVVKKSLPGTKIAYTSYYDRHSDRRDTVRTRTGYGYDDVIFDNQRDAKNVLEKLEDVISVYNVVSVLDLYDMVGIPTNTADDRYGWTNLRNAEIISVRDGYMLKLPKALPID